MKYFRGHEFEFKLIRPSMIVKDIYQRKIDAGRVDKIIKEFDGDIFNEPKVSYRDGKYWVFDGQNSLAVWRKMFGDEKPILCKVYKGMTWVDECEAFIKQNGLAKVVNMRDMLRAAALEKREDVVAMIRGAEEAGFIVDFNLSKGPGRIVATTALYKAHAKLGYAKYVEMLGVIKSAWNGDIDSIRQNMIGAVTEIFEKNYGEFSARELAKSLSKVRPVDIIRDGNGSKAGIKKQIVKIYNKKRRTNKIKEE